MANLGIENLNNLLLWPFQPLHIFFGLSIFFIWSVFHAFFLSPLRNVPGPFWSRISRLPLFYHVVCGTEPKFIRLHAKKYKGVFVMSPDRVAICNLKDCHTVLGSHAFLKDKKYSNMGLMEPNMFLTVDPELNKQRRGQLGPTMGLANLKHMEPIIMAAGSKQLCSKWDRAIGQSKDGKTAKLCYHTDFMLMNFDIISSLGFGQAHRSLTSGDTQIADWVHSTCVLMYMQAIIPIFKSKLFRRFLIKPLYDKYDAFFAVGTQAIEKRKQLLSNLKPGDSKPKDLLQSYIDAEDPESRIRMTSGQVATETINGLMAGSDTSSNTLAWVIHFLFLYPEKYFQVVKEVRSQFDRDHMITFNESRAYLPFLQACIYETLRLVPATNDLPRRMPPDGAFFQGHYIPKGYTCTVSLSTINRLPSMWERPEEFYPERFTDNEENWRQILSFSSGVRACPGKNLAWMQVLPTMANIFNKYNLKLPEDSLFMPGRVDKLGNPIFMPSMVTAMTAPKYPERDCVALISKRT